MKFMLDGKWVVLKMSGRGSCKVVGPSEMERLMKHVGQYFTITLTSQPSRIENSRKLGDDDLELLLEMTNEMRTLLESFAKVLEESKTLPPLREFDY